MTTIQVNILLEDEELVGMVIALLSDVGYDAFEETDGMLSAFIDETKYVQRVLTEILCRANHPTRC